MDKKRVKIQYVEVSAENAAKRIIDGVTDNLYCQKYLNKDVLCYNDYNLYMEGLAEYRWFIQKEM